MKLDKGDMGKIVGNTPITRSRLKHDFTIGQYVRVIDVNFAYARYTCEDLNGEDYFYIHECDIELIKQ